MAPKSSSCRQCLELYILTLQSIIFLLPLTFKLFSHFRHLLCKILLNIGFSLVLSLTPHFNPGREQIIFACFFLLADFFPIVFHHLRHHLGASFISAPKGFLSVRCGYWKRG